MRNFRQRVELAVRDSVAHVTLSRPDKRNALDMDMFYAIVEAQKAVQREPGIRAVILGGAGEDFCSGLDVKSVMKKKSSSLKLLWKWWPGSANLAQQVSTGWRRMRLPVIASVQGRCWGGGLQIALGADFRFVHPNASLSVMEGKWGLIPDMGGTLALRELMPRDQAMRLAMTAELIDAQKAHNLGLATGIYDDPAAASLQLAATLVERSPDAVAAVKRLYRKSWQGSEGAALARESWYQASVITGANQRIAVKRELGEDIAYK